MVFIREHTHKRGSGCWEWYGKYRKGQPVVDVGTRVPNSVRRYNYCVEYIPAGEPWPEREAIATCGNRKCVNPEHTRMPLDKPKEVTEDQPTPGILPSLKIRYRP